MHESHHIEASVTLGTDRGACPTLRPISRLAIPPCEEGLGGEVGGIGATNRQELVVLINRLVGVVTFAGGDGNRLSAWVHNGAPQLGEGNGMKQIGHGQSTVVLLNRRIYL